MTSARLNADIQLHIVKTRARFTLASLPLNFLFYVKNIL